MRKIPVMILLFVLTACATGARDWRDPEPTANPSRVIATELAFARAAREEGQWLAFREFATDDAVMFVPEPVNAQDWLEKQQHPPEDLNWQPHQVWSSCDGSLAVTKGAWQSSDGSTGYFTTVWERQRNGSYKWTMDQGDALPQPLKAPSMIKAEVADCINKPSPPLMVTSEPSTSSHRGMSNDQTLYWQVLVSRGGARSISVRYWDGGQWQDALAVEVVQGD